MNGAVPYFFLSYSRADAAEAGKYLDRFFEDLRKRVADQLGMAITETDPDKDEKLDRVGFRDRYGVKTGQDWMEKIGAAIQHSAVLVCVYSPNFFSRGDDKQFCAREFTAFLMRNRDKCYVPATGEPDKEFQLRGARNILPIVWWKLDVLEKRKLPPYVVRMITWALDHAVPESINNLYLKLGLRRIIQNQRRSYEDILDYFAERIIELAEHPLPALDAVPDIERLRNAFWNPPEEHEIDHAAVAAPVAEAIVAPATSGPTRMLVIEVRRAEEATDWCPYAGELSIPVLCEEIANQKELTLDWKKLDPSAAGFAVQMSAALQAAARNSIRAILVVDPRCLANEIGRRALIALLQERYRAGFLVPADETDRDAVRLIELYRASLHPAEDAPDWVMRISTGNVAQFRIAVSSLADDILARIVKTDPVRQSPPDNAGPTTLPRIANQLEAAH